MLPKSPGICGSCIKKNPDQALAGIEKIHAEIRIRFGLSAPEGDGVRCRLCANGCSIPQGGSGYCGPRKNVSQPTALHGVFITKR